MTPELIEHFRPVLESLERERLKVLHDRKAYLFIILLVLVLAVCLAVAAVLGPSTIVLLFSFLLGLMAAGLGFVRSRLFSSYQRNFRDRFTRDWFRFAYPGSFLTPAPSPDQIPIEVSRGLREAAIRATAQVPSKTAIEERIFFDTDTYHSWTFVLVERSRFFKRVLSRAIVWFRASNEESKQVAFVWPPAGISREPDLRFFMDGVPVAATEPLRSKLLAVYQRLRAKSSNQAVRVSLSPTGVWAGVRLSGSFFEAPTALSALSPESYSSWPSEGALPADREIVSLLFTI